MATNYVLTVENYQGVRHSDTISSDLRKEIDSLERSDEFNLGHRVGTWTDPELKDESGHVKWYYYHNGRIRVTTRYHQLTSAQRQGRRSY